MTMLRFTVLAVVGILLLLWLPFASAQTTTAASAATTTAAPRTPAPPSFPDSPRYPGSSGKTLITGADCAGFDKLDIDMSTVPASATEVRVANCPSIYKIRVYGAMRAHTSLVVTNNTLVQIYFKSDFSMDAVGVRVVIENNFFDHSGAASIRDSSPPTRAVSLDGTNFVASKILESGVRPRRGGGDVADDPDAIILNVTNNRYLTTAAYPKITKEFLFFSTNSGKRGFNNPLFCLIVEHNVWEKRQASAEDSDFSIVYFSAKVESANRFSFSHNRAYIRDFTYGFRLVSLRSKVFRNVTSLVCEHNVIEAHALAYFPKTVYLAPIGIDTLNETLRWEGIGRISLSHNLLEEVVVLPQGRSGGSLPHDYMTVNVYFPLGGADKWKMYPQVDRYYFRNIGEWRMDFNTLTMKLGVKEDAAAVWFDVKAPMYNITRMSLDYNRVTLIRIFHEVGVATFLARNVHTSVGYLTTSHNVNERSVMDAPPEYTHKDIDATSRPYSDAYVANLYLQMDFGDPNLLTHPKFPDARPSRLEAVNNSGYLHAGGASIVRSAVWNVTMPVASFNISHNRGTVIGQLFPQRFQRDTGCSRCNAIAGVRLSYGARVPARTHIIFADNIVNLTVLPQPDRTDPALRKAFSGAIGVNVVLQQLFGIELVHVARNNVTTRFVGGIVLAALEDMVAGVDITTPLQCRFCELWDNSPSVLYALGHVVVENNTIDISGARGATLSGTGGIALRHATGFRVNLSSIVIRGNSVRMTDLTSVNNNPVFGIGMVNFNGEVISVVKAFPIVVRTSPAMMLLHGDLNISGNDVTLEVPPELPLKSTSLIYLCVGLILQVRGMLGVSDNNLTYAPMLAPVGSMTACVLSFRELLGEAKVMSRAPKPGEDEDSIPRIDANLGPANDTSMSVEIGHVLLQRNRIRASAVTGLICSVANMSVISGVIELVNNSISLDATGAVSFNGAVSLLAPLFYEPFRLSLFGAQPQQVFAFSKLLLKGTRVNVTTTSAASSSSRAVADFLRLYRSDFKVNLKRAAFSWSNGTSWRPPTPPKDVRDVHNSFAVEILNGSEIVLRVAAAAAASPAVMRVESEPRYPASQQPLPSATAAAVGIAEDPKRFDEINMLGVAFSVTIHHGDSGGSSNRLDAAPFVGVPGDFCNITVVDGRFTLPRRIAAAERYAALATLRPSPHWSLWRSPAPNAARLPTWLSVDGMRVTSENNDVRRLVAIATTLPAKPPIPLFVKCYFWNGRRVGRSEMYGVSSGAQPALDWEVCDPGASKSPSRSESPSLVPLCAAFDLTPLLPYRLSTVSELLRRQSFTFTLGLTLRKFRDTQPPAPQKIVPPTAPPAGSEQRDAATFFKEHIVWNSSMAAAADAAAGGATAKQQQQQQQHQQQQREFLQVVGPAAGKIVITRVAVTSARSLSVDAVVLDMGLDREADFVATVRLDHEAALACRTTATDGELLDDINNRVGNNRVAVQQFTDFELRFARVTPEISEQLIAFATTTSRIAIVATAGTSGPMVAQTMSRSLMLGRYVDCVYDASESPLAFELCPLQWEVGRQKGRYLRGCLVGNGTLLFLFLAVLTILIFVWLTHRERKSREKYERQLRERNLPSLNSDLAKARSGSTSQQQLLLPVGAADPAGSPSSPSSPSSMRAATDAVGQLHRNASVRFASHEIESEGSDSDMSENSRRAAAAAAAAADVDDDADAGDDDAVRRRRLRRQRELVRQQQTRRHSSRNLKQQQKQQKQQQQLQKPKKLLTWRQFKLAMFSVGTVEMIMALNGILLPGSISASVSLILYGAPESRTIDRAMAAMCILLEIAIGVWMLWVTMFEMPRRPRVHFFYNTASIEERQAREEESDSPDETEVIKFLLHVPSKDCEECAAEREEKRRMNRLRSRRQQLARAAEGKGPLGDDKNQAAFGFSRAASLRVNRGRRASSSALLVDRESSNDLLQTTSAASFRRASSSPLVRDRSASFRGRSFSFAGAADSGVFSDGGGGPIGRDIAPRVSIFRRAFPYLKTFFQYQGVWKIARMGDVGTAKKQKAEKAVAKANASPFASFRLQGRKNNDSHQQLLQLRDQREQDRETRREATRRAVASDRRFLVRCGDCFRDVHDRSRNFLSLMFLLIFVMACIEGYVPAARSSSCMNVGLVIALLNCLPLGILLSAFPYRHWMMNAYGVLAGVAIAFQSAALCVSYMYGDYNIEWIHATSAILNITLQLLGVTKMMLDVVMVFFESPYFVIYILRRVRHTVLHQRWLRMTIFGGGGSGAGGASAEAKRKKQQEQLRLQRQRDDDEDEQEMASLRQFDHDDVNGDTALLGTSRRQARQSNRHFKPHCWDLSESGLPSAAPPPAAAAAASSSSSPSSAAAPPLRRVTIDKRTI